MLGNVNYLTQRELTYRHRAADQIAMEMLSIVDSTHQCQISDYNAWVHSKQFAYCTAAIILIISEIIFFLPFADTRWITVIPNQYKNKYSKMVLMNEICSCFRDVICSPWNDATISAISWRNAVLWGDISIVHQTLSSLTFRSYLLLAWTMCEKPFRGDRVSR